MTFTDTYNNEEYTLLNLFHDWKLFRLEDPDNHANRFRTELYEILMASVNGRNDLEIIGLTPHEVSNYIIKLRKVVA